MMGVLETVVGARIEGFNAQRGVFLDPLARCFLLKRAVQTKRFAVVAEITNGWSVKFNEYRGQMKFRFAVVENTFADLIAQTSHIGYGVADGADQIDIYAIDPERRDVIPPTVSSPLWKVYGSREPIERFLIPPPPEDVGGVL